MILQKLCAKARQLAQGSRSAMGYATPISDLFVFCTQRELRDVSQLQQSGICLILKGHKDSRIGCERYQYQRAEYACYNVDLPIITEYCLEQGEYLDLRLFFDLPLMRQMIDELQQSGFQFAPVARQKGAAAASEELLQAFSILLSLADKPQTSKILQNLAKKAIYYYLLLGPQGGTLRQMALQNSNCERINRAAQWIVDNYQKPLHMPDLAVLSGMSESGFYAHFRKMSGMSPLQYQKNLRLTQAQHLIKQGGNSISSAAFAVGYDNLAQFSREYKRYFGHTPRSELQQAKENFMNPKFAPLFQEYRFNNGVNVKNRFVVAPMTHFGSNEDGTLGAQEREFIRTRAGGAAIFISAATLVADGGKAFHGQPEAIHESQLASLKETAELIKSQGAKALLQIHHGGKQAITELLNGQDKISASADEATGTRAATSAEVQALVAAFANAADLALRAGFDGVEIHGANNYLIQQFYSGHSNRRTDEWGGSREKRMAFPAAIIDAVLAVKAKHQRDDFIVGYRFSPEEPEELGLTMEDTFALIDMLVTKPLQYLHVSLWDFYKKARRGADSNAYRMQLLHERIAGKLPLIGVGNLYTPEEILAAFNSGWAEFIALGKTLMVNPDLVEKIQRGEDASIQRAVDPNQADHYGFPDFLWNFTLQGTQAWLPPLKGQDAKILDI